VNGQKQEQKNVINPVALYAVNASTPSTVFNQKANPAMRRLY
jgi:hypothetical protein